MAVPLQLLHQTDPRQQIMDEVGPVVSGIQIRPYEVMLVTYQRGNLKGPKVTLGGIHLSDKTMGEDTYQEKAALLMKKGALAFTDDGDHKWEGFNPQVGDWVAIRPSDTFWFDVPGGWRIRLVDENLVQAILPAPDIVS